MMIYYVALGLGILTGIGKDRGLNERIRPVQRDPLSATDQPGLRALARERGVLVGRVPHEFGSDRVIPPGVRPLSVEAGEEFAESF